MDLTLIKLTLEGLAQKLSNLESQNKKLFERLDKIEQNAISSDSKHETAPTKEDVLIDTKEVLKMLGISYNTLRAIIKNNLIFPIRINQRRIRYSKNAILAYIHSKKG